ncbi:MAG TPA: hypothetical protein DDY87_04390 [Clostridiales bacterium]|nr:hypothetical protein [Clostridiales bacterium]
MTIEQCYAQMGGSFAEVSARLPSTRLIEKFVRKFPEDPSYGQLKQSLAENCLADAFRAAHTLKGVAANLSFASLRRSASDLTELLRHAEGIPAQAQALFAQVTRDYEATLAAISQLD